MDGMNTIDLNSDLGEIDGARGVALDQEILSAVSSANIACGFHAGHPFRIAQTVRLAVGHGVAIGAHVSYPDRSGFGRRYIDVTYDELMQDVLYQIGALAAIARAAGGAVRYVKPHGALYHRIATHEGHAAAVVGAISRYDDELVIMGLPGTTVLDLAEAAGLTTVTECFADRGYLPGGGLVPRGEPNAVITDERAVVARVLQMAREGTVTAIDGTTVSLDARSICVHGDTPGASSLALAVRAGLAEAGVTVGSFCD